MNPSTLTSIVNEMKEEEKDISFVEILAQRSNCGKLRRIASEAFNVEFQGEESSVWSGLKFYFSFSSINNSCWIVNYSDGSQRVVSYAL